MEIIYSETGIDKKGDVLESPISGELYEKMMKAVIMEEKDPEEEVRNFVANLEDEIKSNQSNCPVYEISDNVTEESAEQHRTHPLPDWIERMTVSYIRQNGGKAEKGLWGWNLQWPDGLNQPQVVFRSDPPSDLPLLNLDHPKIRSLLGSLPRWILGQPVPIVKISGLENNITGYWGIFEIRLKIESSLISEIRMPPYRKTFLPIYMNFERKIYLPSGKHIHELLLTEDIDVLEYASEENSILIYEKLLSAIESEGESIYQNLEELHALSIDKERKRGRIFFDSRKKAILKIGLPEVRNYRLNQLKSDEVEWERELERISVGSPEIRTILLLQIGQNNESK
ncbi:MAG: hypothetical protein KDK54_20565 [Leptospiraceae bacterium]|nr:hypothetical protein [Leptospiraceae bacterium]